MSDNINIIIKALLAQSGEGSLKSIEEKIEALQEKLDKKGLTLKLDLTKSDIDRLTKAAADITKAADDASKKAGNSASDSMKSAVADAEKYKNALADIKSELASLQKQRDELIRKEKSNFENYLKNDDPIFSKLKRRTISTPKAGDPRYSDYKDYIPNDVKGNYFNKNGGTPLDKMAQEMGVTEQQLFNALKNGKPKFDESSLKGTQAFDYVDEQIKFIEKLQKETEEAMNAQKPFAESAQKATEQIEKETKAVKELDNALSGLSKRVTVKDGEGNVLQTSETFNNKKTKGSITHNYEGENLGQDPKNSIETDNPAKLAEAKKILEAKATDYINRLSKISNTTNKTVSGKANSVAELIDNLTTSSDSTDFSKVENELKQLEVFVNKREQLIQKIRGISGSQNITKDQFSNVAKMVLGGSSIEDLKKAENAYNELLDTMSLAEQIAKGTDKTVSNRLQQDISNKEAQQKAISNNKERDRVEDERVANIIANRRDRAAALQAKADKRLEKNQESAKQANADRIRQEDEELANQMAKLNEISQIKARDRERETNDSQEAAKEKARIDNENIAQQMAEMKSLSNSRKQDREREMNENQQSWIQRNADRDRAEKEANDASDAKLIASLEKQDAQKKKRQIEQEESEKASYERSAKAYEQMWLKAEQTRANQIERSQNALQKQLLNLYSTGKADKSKYENIGDQIANADTFDKLKRLKAELNDISRIHIEAQTAAKGALKGTEIGQNSKLEGANINNVKDGQEFIKIIKESVPALQDRQIIQAKLNQTTGEWNVLLRETSSSNTRLTGIIDISNGKLLQQASAIEGVSNANRGMLSQFKIALERVPVWIAAMTVFYGTKRALEDMVKNIIEIDKQMTELKRVMNEGTNFDNMLKTSTSLAKELGQTITDVNEAMIGFAQAGFDNKQIEDLTKTAIVMSNVSNLTVKESMDDITSAMVQFNIAASESIGVVDKLNEVDNNFAITTSDLAEAVKKSGSTAETFGVSLDELIGHVTAIGVATRESGDVIGNSLKTIYSRLASDDSANALAGVGVAIKEANGQNKDASVILDELAKKWTGLSSTQQQNLGIVVAGRYQLSRFLALMNEWKVATDATKASINSQGSAMRENSKYQESLEARINKLKAAWQELSLTFGESIINDSLVSTIQVITSFVGAIGGIVKYTGVLPALFLAMSFAIGLLYPQLLKVITAFGMQIIEGNALAVTLRGVATAFGFVKASLVGFGVFGAVAIAIGYALDKIIAGVAKFSEETKNESEIGVEHVLVLQSQKDGLKQLGDEYEALRKKVNMSSDERERLLQIENDLVDKYGVSITGINDQGKAYSNSTEAINERVKSLQNEIAAENELNKIKFKAQDSSNTTKIAESKEDLAKIKKQLDDKTNIMKQFEDKVSKKQDIPMYMSIAADTSTSLDLKYSELIQEYKDLTKNMDDSSFGVDAGDDEYDDLTQMIRKKMSERIIEIQKAYAEANDKVQIPIKSISNILKTDAQIYISELVSNGAKISDAQKAFVLQMVNSVANNGQGLEQQETVIKGLIDSVNSPAFSNMIKKYNDSKKAFELDPTIANGKDFKSSSDALIKFADDLSKTIPNSAKDAKDAVKAFNDTIKQNYGATEVGKQSAVGFSNVFTDLAENFNKGSEKIRDLNKDLKELSEGHGLSGERIAELILQYPELASGVEKVSDGYKISTTVLEKYREGLIKTKKEELATQLGLNKASIEGLGVRLKAYGIEIKAIQSLSDAKKAEAGIVPEKTLVDPKNPMLDQSNKFQNINSNNPFLKNNILTGIIAKTADDTKLRKAQEDADKVKGILENYGTLLDQQKALNDILSDNSFGVKAEKEDKTEKEMYKINDFESAMSALDAQIKESESSMGDYLSTSKEYRNELEKQIKIMEKKQELSHNEANRLRNEDVGIQSEIAALGDWNSLSDAKKEKFNKLSKQLEDNQKQIQQLAGDWWDFQAQVDTKRFDVVNSKIGEMADAMSELDYQLETSRLKMGLLNNDSAEYRKELVTQIDIMKKKQDQAHVEAEYIREQLANNNLTLQQQKELNKQLKELSKNWFEYAGSIKQANDELQSQREDVATKFLDMYKDMYKKQREIDLEAIDERSKSLEKSHKEEMDRLDDQQNKYEDIIKAKIKSLENVSDDRQYNQELKKKQDERQNLLNQKNVLALDNSTEAKARLKDLNKQLADIDMELENMKYNHSTEVQKKALDSQLEASKKKNDEDKKLSESRYEKEKDGLENIKKATEKYYDDILEDEKKMADFKNEILNGTINTAESKFAEFRKYIQDHSTQISSMLKKSYLDRMDELTGKLKIVQNEFSKIQEMMTNSLLYQNASAEDKSKLNNRNKDLADSIGGVTVDENGDYKKDGDYLYFYNPVSSDERSAIEQMKINSQKWKETTDPARRKQLSDANELMGTQVVHAMRDESGTWRKMQDGKMLKLYHKGGIIGDNGDGFTNLVNKMFNASSNEQVVMALKDELMIPSDNIAKNFKPNMNKLLSSMSSGVALDNSGDVIYQISINVEKLTGDADGAKTLLTELVKGVKKRGGKV